MCSVKNSAKYLKLIICLVSLIITISFIHGAGIEYKYDTLSFEKARALFSRPKSKYGGPDEFKIWNLADREISLLKKKGLLPKIYSNANGREMFVSMEIIKASERLLTRIEMDSYTPVVIDEDSTIFDIKIDNNSIQLCNRVSREIQYCLLQYGTDVLEIPALANYFTHLKKCGVDKVFVDPEAKEILNDLAKSIIHDGKESYSDADESFLLLSGADGQTKYLVSDPRKKTATEKRKLVTIQPKKSKSVESLTKKPQISIATEQKRIIARPKKFTRQTIHGQVYDKNLPVHTASIITKQLASKKSAGVNILDLIKQENLSEKFDSLGYEAQLILAWQSVVDAQKQFNEDSDYEIQGLPNSISTYILHQASPDFSLSNFQNSCVEIILFRNSQIEKGLIDGKQTLFYLKDGEALITSKHIFKTAAMQLCKIAQEYYLPDIIKNSDKYIDRLRRIEIKEDTEEYKEDEKPMEISISKVSKPKLIRQKLIDSYKKSLTKRGLIPLLTNEDSVWVELENCNTGECVNELVYKDLSYWFVPVGSVISTIFRVSSENYSDSLIIFDFSEPLVAKVGNIFDSSGETVFDLCLKYLEILSEKEKLNLVIGGIYSDIGYLFRELCKEVSIELSKNESFLTNKQSLIGISYELELLFCGVLGVPPKGRSTDASKYKTEMEMLSSGIVYSGRDIWALEECASLLPEQLNYLLCLGAFSNGFISHLFPKSRESVIPITLFCKAYLLIEKEMKDPFDPHQMGTYLSNVILENGISEYLPFKQNPNDREKKVMTKFFIELCNQFKKNHENHFYVDQRHVYDSILRIHSLRLCSAPLFPFLPFEIKLYPIDKKLVSSLMDYGFNFSLKSIIPNTEVQACLGINYHITNYLHVLAAIVEAFVNNYIDPKKIGINNVNIPVNSLCLWWKHPVKYSFGDVLSNMLPFMSKQVVSEYVLRYCLLMESVNFPAHINPEKRIEFIYSTPQISSNRAVDLPKNLIFPEFNPPNDVFLELQHYLRRDVISLFKKFEQENPIIGKKLTFEEVSSLCQYLEEWQVYLLISFQNTVTTVLKTVFSKLYFNTEFEIPILELCNWVSTKFPKNSVGEITITSSDAGNALEDIVGDKVPWLQKSIGEYLMKTFIIWAQTAFVLRIGEVRAKKINKNQMDLSDIKKLFDKKITSLVETPENPKIIKMDGVNYISRLRLNPFVDPTVGLPDPKLESSCDSLWVANLMIAFRVYFLAFQEKFIQPIFHGEFDPFIICEIVKEIVKNKIFQNGFGDAFFRVFKHQKWISNKQLVRILVKNATIWIQDTFELPGIPTYDASHYKDEKLLECYKLSFSMENRPITSSIMFSINEIKQEAIPKFKIIDFPTLSLKSIEPFLITRDPVEFYNIDDCVGLSDSEIRMIVSLSSFFETTSKGLFISQVPTFSPKKGLLEELQFEFPISVICKWWSFVKSTDTSPNYSTEKNSWSSILQKRIREHYSEKIKSNPEMNFPWKEWFTVPVAESLLYSFFKSIIKNTKNNISKVEVITDEGFFNQSHIRSVAVIEDLFKSSINYRHITPFHRALIDIKNLPLTYFDYFHLPADNYNEIAHFLKNEHRRPLNYPEIMVGRFLHQSEINKCVHMAFVTNKSSKLAINNRWKINVQHLFESFKNYRSSDLSLESWVQHFRLSISNSALTARAAFIVYVKFLMEEARIVNFDEKDDNMRETADRQIEEYYSNSIQHKSSFTQNPTKNYFPLFQINDNNEFSDMRLDQKNSVLPPPMMRFTRFEGKYWRTKLSLTIRDEQRITGRIELIPQIWPSIGEINIPDENYFRVISEARVYSRYNCNGLSVWQVNRAAYWAGMLQRYINKGSRLIKNSHSKTSNVSKKWSIKLKPRKLPNIKNVNIYNMSFNVFDMFFFYKVLNYFHNEIEDNKSDSNKKGNSWEEEHDNLPYYAIHLFKDLFGEYYNNLTYSHIVIFFNELLLEEKRIIKLKIDENSIYKTDIEKLMVIYHAPLFSEPEKFVYPGLFFELRSPLPVSWDKAVKFDDIIIPLISIRSDDFNSFENKYYLNGQKKSELPLREINSIKKEYESVIGSNFFQNLQIYYNTPLEKKVESIIQKGLPLSGKRWNSVKQIYELIEIDKNSMYWNHLSYTYTNGLDWFVNFSTLALESTVFSEVNLLSSIIEEMAKIIPHKSRDILFSQDPNILPSIFNNVNSFDLIFKSGENPDETLAEICKHYVIKTGPISHLFSSSIENGHSSKVFDECKKVASLWEGVLPLLSGSFRKIFLMEFIRRIKQNDAELGSKLIWPTSPNLFTLDWSLFSKSTSKNIKLNQSCGSYDFYFWDPALVLNAFITNAEINNLYFGMSFAESQIIEISQTPGIELWSWISTSHSPIYETNKIFNFEMITQLFISYIDPMDFFNLNKAKNTKIEFSQINTIFTHCIKWFNKAEISLSQVNSICKEIENKYGKSIILFYSKPHVFDFIYSSLILLIDKHPVSYYSDHLTTEKLYRTQQTIYKAIEKAVYSYGIEDVITLTILGSDVKSKIYLDETIMGMKHLQRIPAEMLNILVKKKMLIFSDSFFINNGIINNAFSDSLEYLQLKTNRKMELEIEPNTSLDDLEAQCKAWIDTYYDSIFELDTNEIKKNSIKIVESRSRKNGEVIIDLNTNNGVKIRDAICKTFSELLSPNHQIFSMKNKKLFNFRLKNIIAESQKIALENNIFGWIEINKIVSLWSKDYSLRVSPHLFLNLIMKLSVKNLTQMSQYSFTDFIRETGIKKLNFFFNYELILRTAIEVAYDTGFLMVTENISQFNIIPKNEGVEKLTSEEIIKICSSYLDYMRENSQIRLIKINQKSNGEKVNYKKLLIQICKGVYTAEQKMFENFVESKSRRMEIVMDLYNRILKIDKVVISTSFSFFDTEKEEDETYI
ncbi:hypothetical protein FG386_000024 [Cryptosporidium ryanae]|uniref:uncharacterized protein n=1 Tax=Cryptosporidium ryanae TaxID=515981 RepID=UPI003519E3AD|nr:hypothetical protein FG386_000024 [Cryptosporidium ryanae]